MVKVLVVDDNRAATETTAMILKMYGHTVECAYDGAEALSKARQFVPDVVVLDIGLPIINGYEVAKRLRRMRRLPQLKLIALTGYGQASDKHEALVSGFDVHFTKPAEVNALMAEIESIP